MTAGTAAPNAKMNKSGILKKSIEKIRSLEAENVQLKMENRKLKEMLNGKHITETMPLLSPPISNIASPIPASPTSSHGGDSINQIVNKSQMETDQQKIIFIQRGIAPHSKFALCIFMFAVIALNNFGVLLNTEPDSVFSASRGSPSRRTILTHVIDDVS